MGSRPQPGPLPSTSHFRFWHKCEVPTASSYVRVWRQSGKHLLAMSVSHFDPTRTSALIPSRLVCGCCAIGTRHRNRDDSRALLVRAGYDCASFDGAGASGMNAKRRRGEPARGAALIGASLAFALVAPALLARVGGWRERQRRAMADLHQFHISPWARGRAATGHLRGRSLSARS
jgi:hypothetical protein